MAIRCPYEIIRFIQKKPYAHYTKAFYSSVIIGGYLLHLPIDPAMHVSRNHVLVKVFQATLRRFVRKILGNRHRGNGLLMVWYICLKNRSHFLEVWATFWLLKCSFKIFCGLFFFKHKYQLCFYLSCLKLFSTSISPLRKKNLSSVAI